MSIMAFFDMVWVRKRWRRGGDEDVISIRLVTKITPFGSYAWTKVPSVSRHHLLVRKVFSAKRVFQRTFP
jgi:hypothetical protein